MVHSIPECFMLGLLLGAAFGPVYEALRLLRLILRFDAAVIACDIAFFVLAAEGVFRLSLSLGNYVRVYTILGFAAGVFAYIVTIGRLFNAIEGAAAALWRKTIGKAARKAAGALRRGIGAFAQFMRKGFGKVADFSRYVEENTRKHLQSNSKKMYNNKADILRGSVKANVIRARVKKTQ